ncbi:MAG TPA: hypothetical protein VMW24_12965, partial [Sedimentisphaerales bacterium]|nr:hypothetical protein [Sedimentisphaerales bacterium]
MARYFHFPSYEYLHCGTSPVATTPITMACWFRVTDWTAWRALMSVALSTSEADYHLLYALGGGGHV